MLGRQNRWQEDLFILAPLSSLIPEDHILKRVDKFLDLSWLREELSDVYCDARVKQENAQVSLWLMWDDSQNIS